MKRLALVVALLAAAPALAQPPSAGVDWSKAVTGVDAPAARTPETIEITLDLIYEGPVQKPPLIAPIVIENPEAAATPLPPPCEPPLSRTPTEPPEPPLPSPAPCRP